MCSGRRDADWEVDGSVLKLVSAGVQAHHAHQHGLARSAVQVEDGDEHDCKASGDHEVAHSKRFPLHCEVFQDPPGYGMQEPTRTLPRAQS